LRSTSQIISYEVSLTVIFFSVVLLVGSFNINDIVFVQQQVGGFYVVLLPIIIIFIISVLAETNRAPFDLPEAEAEIVAGYNLEYSSIIFAIFFLAEYSNIILISALTVILFFSGPVPFLDILSNCFLIELIFCVKVICMCFFLVLIRATFPRLRYDQLIRLGWIVFLPFTCCFCFFIFGLKLSFGGFGYVQISDYLLF
jgi:NADH-quinone oxidoreductase subunit H